MRVFIDTNIFLDYVLARSPFYQQAYELMVVLNDRSIKTFTNPNNFQHAFFFLSKEYAPERARHELAIIRPILDCARNDAKVVDKALSRFDPSDMEDAVTLELALSVDAEFMITRDKSEFNNKQVRVMTPGEFVSYFYTS